jgi:hypothetical protein
MNPIINTCLLSFEFGEVQTFENMAVVPILGGTDGGGPDYTTLKDALERGLVVVTEVSAGGSVPNLKVTNKADIAVLMLDGEELAGAKQNRVLNTTILVGARSELIVPVSCVEQGRWLYASPAFYSSENVMAPKMRMRKNVSVSDSLRASNEFRADQGQVWDEVHRMARDANVESATGAMRDVYEKRAKELEDYVRAFTCADGQRGVVVVVGGEAVGFDYLGKERVFGELFGKLIKSYAMEAWLEARKKMGVGEKKDENSGESGGANKGAAAKDEARAFFGEAAACEEKRYPSVGLGSDYRFSGPRMVGSALGIDQHIAHIAFFRVTEAEKAGTMAGSNRRRSFRM